MERNIRSRMAREFARHEYHRERLEYSEERDWLPNAMEKMKRYGSQYVNVV